MQGPTTPADGEIYPMNVMIGIENDMISAL